MNRLFIALLGLTLLAMVGVLLYSQSPEDSLQDQVLLNDLGSQLNRVQSLQVVVPGGQTQVTLVRDGQAWLVEEQENYPADWTTLRELFQQLLDARVLEEKTANPEYYSRLGVSDIDNPDALGKQLTLKPESGQDVVNLIVGNQAQGRAGRYVRLADQAQSLLVDQDLSVPASVADWLERAVVDIQAVDVAEVEIAHEDGELLHIRKASGDDTDFTLVNKPEDAELEATWSLSSLANIFSSLRLEAVRKDTGAQDSDIQIRLLTFGSLQINADITVEDDRYWMRLSASEYQSDDSPESVESGLSERVNEINRRVEGWSYEIPQYKYEAINKRLDDVLKGEEDSP